MFELWVPPEKKEARVVRRPHAKFLGQLFLSGSGGSPCPCGQAKWPRGCQACGSDANGEGGKHGLCRISLQNSTCSQSHELTGGSQSVLPISWQLMVCHQFGQNQDMSCFVGEGPRYQALVDWWKRQGNPKHAKPRK